MLSSISSFEIINVAVPELGMSLWIPASAANAAVNPNGKKYF